MYQIYSSALATDGFITVSRVGEGSTAPVACPRDASKFISLMAARSEEHDEVMRKYSLDRHTASAHLTALRGIERHTTIQKATI
ncbi:MAG: hypothetical protein DRJ51_04485 [Thermoprotei archaeon]|nr:MAG: hypothetical protein DRJ51_04485 [Thermoprotei archaeon]RLE89164.1 MAG: hypothetical protein DRJ49_03840 [Thermoprotei archaeon]